MRIVASIVVILGLLVCLGGIAGLMTGNPTAPIRLGVGIVLIIIAVAIRPKAKPKDEVIRAPRR
jgi:hypothetical protein